MSIGAPINMSIDAPHVISIRSDLDIIVARMVARDIARKMGFNAIDQARIATATSELTRNILVYAREGMVTIREIHDNNRHGIKLIFEDRGPGIPDEMVANQNNNSVSAKAGIGISGSYRLMDQLDIETTIGIGTKITCHKWRR